MAVQFNHTIVWCRDQETTARFLSGLLGLPDPVASGHFTTVRLDNGVVLDCASTGRPVAPQHYAFLVSDEEFDRVHERITAQGIDFWADPFHRRPGRISTWGGRGVYVDDPDGHSIEVLTAAS